MNKAESYIKMRIKVRSLIFTFFMLTIGVNAFAALPVLTGDEPELPKLGITENDKMTTKSGTFGLVSFLFMGIEYNYKRYNEILKLFEIAGIREWEKKSGRKLFEQNPDDYQIFKSIIPISIKLFNEFLSKSQENRNKIAEIIHPEIENSRIKTVKEKAFSSHVSGTKLFLGINGSFLFPLNVDWNINVGLNLTTIWFKASWPINFGFTGFINYGRIFEIDQNKNDNYNHYITYIGTGLLFNILFLGHKSYIHLGLGIEIDFKLSYGNNRRDSKAYFYSGVGKLGYAFIQHKYGLMLQFNAVYKLSSKYTKTGYDGYNELKAFDDNFIGFDFSVYFKIN